MVLATSPAVMRNEVGFMVRLRFPSLLTRCLAALSLIAALLTQAWAKPKFRVLANVSGGLWNGVSLDAKGNLWGVTSGGGNGGGSVFELSPQPGGRWTLATIHSFNDQEGSGPVGRLIFDRAGNVYGTTLNSPSGGGMVYELTPGSTGRVLTVLHDFEVDGIEGDHPSGLVMDAAGNLYGVGGGGGTNGFGVAFELSPGSGGWTEQVLYDFGAHGYDAIDPSGPLLLDRDGSLYGTTMRGGTQEGGTVFRLLPGSGGPWRERLLYSFCRGGGACTDGAEPLSGVIRDGQGTFYGTTNVGGGHSCYDTSCGAVFKLRQMRGGAWQETVLYGFADPSLGFGPGTNGVVLDRAGNLYGARGLGGNDQCQEGCGVVYRLTLRGKGDWEYGVLHKFSFTDGSVPNGGLVIDGRGDLYGTAYDVEFEVSP